MTEIAKRFGVFEAAVDAAMDREGALEHRASFPGYECEWGWEFYWRNGPDVQRGEY